MLPALLTFFWLMIQAFTVFSLLVPAVLYLLSIVRRRAIKLLPESEELHEEKDYAIIVCAHEPAVNLYALLQSLAQLDYTNYMVYVAGSYMSTADAGLYNDKVVYLRTRRSCHSHFLHRFVIENFKRPHTHIAILSSDSRVDKHFLTSLNTFFNQGYQAVACPQLHRNEAGMGNLLQSVICRYQNFFAGSLLFLSGSSAKLCSSGAAFTVHGYKQCLKTKMSSTGFASGIQAKFARRDHQVAFADNAIIFKDSDIRLRQLAMQHAHRVHSWLIGLWHSCKSIGAGIKTWNANRFLFGVTTLRMPLPTALFIGLACFAVNVKIHSPMASLWAIVLLSLPVYVIIAAAQAPGSSYDNGAEVQGEESSRESIALYEESEGYERVMKTV